MQNQGLRGSVPPEWGSRLKGAQFGFIAGIIIGLIFGWIFHGIISFAFRFGLLVLLLLPLIVIGWLWFRSQRSGNQAPPRQGGPVAGGWATVIDMSQPSPPMREQPVRQSPQEVEFVDVPLVRPTASPKPSDIEAELEALKRESERGS
jgi:hypothetical protein